VNVNVRHNSAGEHKRAGHQWPERKKATPTDEMTMKKYKEISAQKLCAGTASLNDARGGRAFTENLSY
jgi:hypothetical protein